jgi:hypothetical protein
MSLARSFSRQHRITRFAPTGSPSPLSLNTRRICLPRGLRAWPGTTTARDRLPSCVTPSLAYYPLRPPALHRLARRLPRIRAGSVSRGPALTVHVGYGNINPLSIDYACRPRLRSRLTLGGTAWPRNPWSFGAIDSHDGFATHACILTRAPSTTGSRRRFTRCTTLPYPTPHLAPAVTPGRAHDVDTTSAAYLSPATLSARNHLTSELLRTLSRVAASKPTSWLSPRSHILSHLARA